MLPTRRGDSTSSRQRNSRTSTACAPIPPQPSSAHLILPPPPRPPSQKLSPPPSNEVHAILRDNAARAEAAGLNRLSEKTRRPSRRKRDYFLTLVVGNIVLFASSALMPVFGAAGLIIFNVGLTWIMWFVMDDY